MDIITDPAVLQATTLGWRGEGLSVGFVPTMGFLHSGHTSLMDLARPRCERLVVSIFVNPLQFGPGEDLDRYPRDIDGDSAKCEAAGVDALFIPDAFYPPDFTTAVDVSELSLGLCGGKRPGHFKGVTTVVARLFGLVQPTLAVFGEKDYQQLAVIRRMVRDLAMPIDIVGGPLIRDADGLALSSRNAYLSEDQRRRGLSLHRALHAIARAARAGERDVAALKGIGEAVVEADRLDYLEVVDAESLAPVARLERPARALVAGFFGPTRLIDNAAVPVG